MVCVLSTFDVMYLVRMVFLYTESVGLYHYCLTLILVL